MRPEQRLDRLERIVKLFVKAGRRSRRELRHQDEKLNMLIDTQIQDEEKYNADASMSALAEAQAQTERRLDELIDMIGGERNS